MKRATEAETMLVKINQLSLAIHDVNLDLIVWREELIRCTDNDEGLKIKDHLSQMEKQKNFYEKKLKVGERLYASRSTTNGKTEKVHKK